MAKLGRFRKRWLWCYAKRFVSLCCFIVGNGENCTPGSVFEKSTPGPKKGWSDTPTMDPLKQKSYDLILETLSLFNFMAIFLGVSSCLFFSFSRGLFKKSKFTEFVPWSVRTWDFGSLRHFPLQWKQWAFGSRFCLDRSFVWILFFVVKAKNSTPFCTPRIQLIGWRRF